MKKLVVLLLLVFSIPVNAEYVNSVSGLNMRENPSLKSKVITVLQYGDEVEVVNKNNKVWWKIKLHDNTYGYVHKEYLQEKSTKEALQYLGQWTITAYAETGYCCANGDYPTTDYTVACNSLPFGTKIYINGVGVRTVEDRGPSSMGDNWADLYLGDYNSCVQWGAQIRDVYLYEVNDDD